MASFRIALFAIVLLATANAADRKCTPAYSHAQLYGEPIGWTLTDSAACAQTCITDARCAGYRFERSSGSGPGSCATLSKITEERYSPDATGVIVSARCMAAIDVQLLVLPQEFADYPGLDVGNAYAANARDCGGVCLNTPGCNAYSWTNYNGGSCWMKSAKPDTAVGPYDGSVVSGEVYTCQRPRFDADATGADLAAVKRSDWRSCCGVCRRTSGCGGFSWSSYNGGTCWLKTKISGFTTSEGVISAVVN